MAKQNHEKSAIMSVLVLIGFVALIYVFNKFTTSVSLVALVVMAILAEEVLILPTINKLYHEYHEMEAPVTRWIPIYNEFVLFSGWVYRASEILTGLLVVALILASPITTYLPISVVSSVRITTYAIYAAIALIIAICIVRGIGFCSIKHEVDMSILDVFEKAPGVVGYFLYVTLFVPLFRCIGLAYLMSDLKRLSMNDIFYGQETSESTEELYEVEFRWR